MNKKNTTVVFKAAKITNTTGLTVMLVNMTEAGMIKIKGMVKAYSNGHKEVGPFMSENIRTIGETAKERLCTQMMGLIMKADGHRTRDTDKERLYGEIKHPIKEISNTTRCTVKEHSHGRPGHTTQEIGKVTKRLVMEKCTARVITARMLEIGSTINVMVKEK